VTTSEFFLIPIVVVEPRPCRHEGCTAIAAHSVVRSPTLVNLGDFCDEHAEDGLRQVSDQNLTSER